MGLGVGIKVQGLLFFGFLLAEFISPQKVYTFGFIVGHIIPKSAKCIHSATKTKVPCSLRVAGFFGFRVCGWPDSGVLNHSHGQETSELCV